tara:strand:- start:1466 stop:1567 length:102 start_codon:yes stop_codon:yes gene_type:complete
MNLKKDLEKDVIKLKTPIKKSDNAVIINEKNDS